MNRRICMLRMVLLALAWILALPIAAHASYEIDNPVGFVIFLALAVLVLILVLALVLGVVLTAVWAVVTKSGWDRSVFVLCWALWGAILSLFAFCWWIVTAPS